MDERKRVEIDIASYQEGIMRMTAAMRDIGPALEAMRQAIRELNRSLTLLLEATQRSDVSEDESSSS